VGADDGAHAAVEVPAHRQRLARRLAVHVDQDDGRLFPQLGQDLVGLAERAVDRAHEHAAHEVDPGHAVRAGLHAHVAHAPRARARRRCRRPSGHSCCYLATSTARVSRITTTLMWPGYCISASMRLEMSFASWWASRSETISARVITRSSRPAWIA